METPENNDTRQDRTILLRPANGGISIVFFTLLVKMDALRKACNGDILAFFRETGDAWDMDGSLCSTAAMSLDDLNHSIGCLRTLGLQYDRPPVDWYLLEGGFTSALGFQGPIFWTLDDGALDFVDEEGKWYARLKGTDNEGRPLCSAL